MDDDPQRGGDVEGEQRTAPWLTIVIPWIGRDRDRLADRLAEINHGWPGAERPEIVLAGGPAERDSEGFAGLSATTVYATRLGRGHQLNVGARAAQGRMLWFHHADNPIRTGHIAAVWSAAADPHFQAGAFYRNVEVTWPGLAWADPFCRLWQRRCGILFGDQSLIVPRATFWEMGGFAEIPLMEDVEMSDRLRRRFRPSLLDPPVSPSPRRFVQRGRMRNKLANLGIIGLYRCGIDTAALYELYYGRRPKPSEKN